MAMTIRTIYICDHCGKEQDKDDRKASYWKVALHVEPQSSSFRSSFPKSHQLWCMECLQDFNILPVLDKETGKTVSKPITLEDVVRDLIREEQEIYYSER